MLGKAPDKGGAQLRQTISEEAQSVQEFVDLLLVEQKALSSGDTDELPILAESKGKLADHLNQLAEQRNAALATLGFGANRDGMESWCAKYPDEQEVARIWANVLTLAREARELNRLNGELIKLRMNATAAALEALRASKSSLDLYGPDGQSARTTGQRRIDHVA